MGNQALYEERLARVTKAMGCEPVDQIPVIYMGVAFSPRYMGMSIAKFCEDPEAAANVTIAAMDRLNRFGGLDGCNAAQTVRITPALTTLWLSRIGVPGRDLPPDSLWQAREEEIMTHADYDTIIEKGWMAFFMEYAPKVIDIGELQEFFSWAHTMGGLLLQRYRDHGYVVIAGGAGSIPFEYLCGGRSMQQFYFDLYRMPDKVQATMDAAFPEIIARRMGGRRARGERPSCTQAMEPLCVALFRQIRIRSRGSRIDARAPLGSGLDQGPRPFTGTPRQEMCPQSGRHDGRP
jgi:hypothetical protein